MRRTLVYILLMISLTMNALIFRGGEIFRIGTSDIFLAAVKTRYFKEYVVRQEEDCWCWVACIHMILLYNVEYVRQSDIASMVFVDSYNRTASGNQIDATFDGWRGYDVHSYQSKKSQCLIDEISSGHPLIIGHGEHAYLLTHIYYKKASNGLLHPFKAILINPKSGKEEVLYWNDMYSKANTIVAFHR